VIDLDSLARTVTGRARDLFEPDLSSQHDEVVSALEGRRLLVIGGSGSIGSFTIRLLLQYRLRALHVVDHNENSLAELARDIRASGLAGGAGEIRLLPLDFGSPTMARLLREAGPYDRVLNFAALKHVRSEKDSVSLLQMLETNVISASRLLQVLKSTSPQAGYFAVSTDKAADPSSLMGASKRLMEHVMFAARGADQVDPAVTSARFANVAFSEGSLLDAVLRRVSKRQLVAVPSNTRRYFMSGNEAAEISLLAAVCAPDQHLLVPMLAQTDQLQELQEVVHRVLEHLGLRGREYHDESEARANVETDYATGACPVLVTQLDTQGEKPYEEFLGVGETAVDIGLKHVRAVRHIPGPPGSLEVLVARLEGAITVPTSPVTKDDIVRWISEAVPELSHAASELTLDDRP
jgi:FlaA1/EpsC-like NDP-sugar epimerase